MKIKNKIFKRKTGKSKGKWIVRISYFDLPSGKTRFMERHADKKSYAIDLKNKLIDDLKKSHGQSQTGERMTFNDLVKACKKIFYKPAEIFQGKKVAGVRSFESIEYQLTTLSNFFGKRLLIEITEESLVDYKLHRLKTNSKRLNRPVKIASVNRELSAMRKMMRFAYGKGWILKDIFFNAKVIDMSSEVERKRLLTTDEEARLLDSCEGERTVEYTRNWKGKEQQITQKLSVNNPHLRALIVLALDSALRKGEILKLKWRDIDFNTNVIHVLGTNTKTERERLAPLTDRAKNELERIRPITAGDNLFPFKDFKRSFTTAKKIAKIDDLHFHDLRRTAITRWLPHIPLAIVAKLAGHAQVQTTMKHYTATNTDMIQEINEKMNAFHAQNNGRSQIESKLVN